MTAFEFVCYAAAILTVLWLRAEPQTPTLPALPAKVLTARPVPAAAAEMAAPVAIVRVEVPTPDWAKMTNAELRRECARKGIALKGEMIKALC